MHVGAGRLDDGDREEVGTVGNAEVRRRTSGLGQPPQGWQGRIPQERLHLPRQCQDSEAEATAPVGPTPHKGMLLEGDNEPIHNCPTHPEGRCDLGDRETLGGVGQEAENSETPVQGLRSLLCHERYAPAAAFLAADFTENAEMISKMPSTNSQMPTIQTKMPTAHGLMRSTTPARR